MLRAQVLRFFQIIALLVQHGHLRDIAILAHCRIGVGLLFEDGRALLQLAQHFLCGIVFVLRFVQRLLCLLQRVCIGQSAVAVLVINLRKHILRITALPDEWDSCQLRINPAQLQ